MSEPSKNLQVVSRDLLERLHGWLTHIHHFRVADMADLEAALKEAPALDAEPISDEELIEIAQKAAVSSMHRYNYMPALQEDADNWMPHRWVIEAMRASLAPHQAEIERLRGLQPESPPRPSEGSGLPRFGLRWNGPSQPLAVPMDDGYWTPWHLADQLTARVSALEGFLSRVIKSGALAFDDGAPEDLESLEADICAALRPTEGAQS